MEDIYTLIIAAVAVGIIAAVITCVCIVVKYKKKLKAPIYPIDDFCSLSLTDRRDDFIGSTVTKVRVSSSKKRD
jgi:hypothetical protein